MIRAKKSRSSMMNSSDKQLLIKMPIDKTKYAFSRMTVKSLKSLRCNKKN